jgi:hypothetical protein
MLSDPQDERILITIRADLDHILILAAGGSFVPALFAAATVIHGLTQRQCLTQGVGVHVGQHEWFMGVSIHRQRCDQAMLIKLGCKGETFFDGLLRVARTELERYRVNHGTLEITPLPAFAKTKMLLFDIDPAHAKKAAYLAYHGLFSRVRHPVHLRFFALL